MNTYIVKDWAGNVMNWGEYETFEDGIDAIYEHVKIELNKEGIDVDTQYPELEKIYSEYVGEYSCEIAS